MNIQRILTIAIVIFFGTRTAAQQAKDSVRVLLLPEFYHNPVVANDTTYSFEFYKKGDKPVAVNSLTNLDDIEDVHYYKSYYQSKTTGGAISAPYLSMKLKTYLKVNDDTWGVVDNITKDYTQLKERRDKIVRTDSAVFKDFKTGNKVLVIRKYYAVQEEYGAKMPPEEH